jgi:hypothetical protein
MFSEYFPFVGYSIGPATDARKNPKPISGLG